MLSAGLPEHADTPSPPMSDSTAAAMTLLLRAGITHLRGSILPTAAGCFAYPMVVRSGWRWDGQAALPAQASPAQASRPAMPPSLPARHPPPPRRQPWRAYAG